MFKEKYKFKENSQSEIFLNPNSIILSKIVYEADYEPNFFHTLIYKAQMR